MNIETGTASELIVQLFIAGDSDQNRAVRKRVSEFAATMLRQPHRLDIIDVLDKPDLADVAHVLVTPTLVIRAAEAEHRLVGDLSDVAKLQLVLSGVSDRPQ